MEYGLKNKSGTLVWQVDRTTYWLEQLAIAIVPKHGSIDVFIVYFITQMDCKNLSGFVKNCHGSMHTDIKHTFFKWQLFSGANAKLSTNLAHI